MAGSETAQYVQKSMGLTDETLLVSMLAAAFPDEGVSEKAVTYADAAAAIPDEGDSETAVTDADVALTDGNTAVMEDEESSVDGDMFV